MKKNNIQRGFSIGEVLIAMFILLIGMIDAMFLTVRSIGDLGNSRSAIVASLLAQEGTELVRNVRDNTVTSNMCGSSNEERCTAFSEEFGFPSASQTGSNWCTPDMYLGDPMANHPQSDVLQCGEQRENLLLNKSGNLFWSHDGGGEWYKGFRRRVYLEYGYTDSDEGADSDGDGHANDVDEKYVDVTSVVVYAGGEFPENAPENIEKRCLKSKNCAYAQTRLTSWINYGD
ncbi:MAG: hypothetical protein CR972_00810 [Candidatus Moraniibacteriota bacterium]|nr:MAG: hypothetical protein CR972_00810 [Candidatus Moranbacteria bacterium]